MLPYFFFFVFHFVFGTPMLVTNNETACKKPIIQQAKDSLLKENAFGKKLYHSLQTANLNEWMTLYPTNAEYLDLLKKMAAKNIDGMTQEKAIALTKKRSKETVAEGKHDFETLQRQAKNAGLLWHNRVYGDFIFDKTPSAIGNNYLNGDIWLRAGKTEFVIECVEAVEILNGYRLQNVITLKKARQ